MSATAFFATVVPAWIAIGLVTAVSMRRRGHALYPWMLLGAFFGPLVVPLVIAARHRARRASTSSSPLEAEAGGSPRPCWEASRRPWRRMRRSP